MSFYPHSGAPSSPYFAPAPESDESPLLGSNLGITSASSPSSTGMVWLEGTPHRPPLGAGVTLSTAGNPSISGDQWSWDAPSITFETNEETPDLEETMGDAESLVEMDVAEFQPQWGLGTSALSVNGIPPLDIHGARASHFTFQGPHVARTDTFAYGIHDPVPSQNLSWPSMPVHEPQATSADPLGLYNPNFPPGRPLVHINDNARDLNASPLEFRSDIQQWTKQPLYGDVHTAILPRLYDVPKVYPPGRSSDFDVHCWQEAGAKNFDSHLIGPTPLDQSQLAVDSRIPLALSSLARGPLPVNGPVQACHPGIAHRHPTGVQNDFTFIPLEPWDETTGFQDPNNPSYWRSFQPFQTPFTSLDSFMNSSGLGFESRRRQGGSSEYTAFLCDGHAQSSLRNPNGRIDSPYALTESSRSCGPSGSSDSLQPESFLSQAPANDPAEQSVVSDPILSQHQRRRRKTSAFFRHTPYTTTALREYPLNRDLPTHFLVPQEKRSEKGSGKTVTRQRNACQHCSTQKRQVSRNPTLSLLDVLLTTSSATLLTNARVSTVCP